jgi:hypothetical protein
MIEAKAFRIIFRAIKALWEGPVMEPGEPLTEEGPARDRADFITNQVEKIDRIEAHLARMESILIRIETLAETITRLENGTR